jgi:hypothetical protein
MGDRDTFLSPKYAWLNEFTPYKACLQRILRFTNSYILLVAWYFFSVSQMVL